MIRVAVVNSRGTSRLNAHSWPVIKPSRRLHGSQGRKQVTKTKRNRSDEREQRCRSIRRKLSRADRPASGGRLQLAKRRGNIKLRRNAGAQSITSRCGQPDTSASRAESARTAINPPLRTVGRNLGPYLQCRFAGVFATQQSHTQPERRLERSANAY